MEFCIGCENMIAISKKEEGTFLLLFNRSGYVLDFTDNTFDVFTTTSIGIPIKEKYGLLKGKSLVAYLNETADEQRTKLLIDLFHYYEGKWNMSTIKIMRIWKVGEVHQDMRNIMQKYMKNVKKLSYM